MKPGKDDNSLSTNNSRMDSVQEMMDTSDSMEGDSNIDEGVDRDELDELFGSASSEGEEREVLAEVMTKMEESGYSDEEGRVEVEEKDEGHPTTSFSMPKVITPAELDCECVLIKVPAFLRTELQEAFDPASTVDQEIEHFGMDPEEIDAHTATRVLTTIRYRTNMTSDDKLMFESNSRLIEWEDGSMSLAIGEELFEVMAQDIGEEHNYIFQRHAGVGCMEVLGHVGKKVVDTSIHHRHQRSSSISCHQSRESGHHDWGETGIR